MSDDQPARLTDARLAEIRAFTEKAIAQGYSRAFTDDLTDLLAHIDVLETALAALRRACHLEMPEGERLSVSGYVCALCLWDADPDDPATHEPTCPLFVSGDAEGVQE